MQTPKKTVAITGASGFLGSALVEYFSLSGWQVIGLVRQPENYINTQNIVYKKYNLQTPLNPTLLKGVDYVVHAAYLKQADTKQNAAEINIQAAEKLYTLSAVKNIKKRVFISSMSAHQDAISVYGKQKLAIEKIFSGKDDVCVRPGLIIGAGGIVKDMLEFMRSKHLVPLVGGGKQPIQIIAVDDLIKAIEKALLGSTSDTLTVAHPTVYTYKEFYKTLARHFKIPVLYIPVPYTLLSVLFKIASVLHLPLRLGEDNLKGLKKLVSVNTEPDLRQLGITVGDLDTALKRIGQKF